MKNSELGIIFLHHKADDVTRHNLESLARYNPDCVIVPISCGERFESTYDAGKSAFWQHVAPNVSPSELQWRNADIAVVDWYLNCFSRPQCERWFICEWDTYCNMSVRDFYQDVWNRDFVCTSVRYPNREPEWNWFSEVSRLSLDMQPFAMGVVPFTCLLISDQALNAISSQVMKWRGSADNWGVMCELRFATTANYLGFPPIPNPRDSSGISWRPIEKQRVLKGESGIWHPAKDNWAILCNKLTLLRETPVQDLLNLSKLRQLIASLGLIPLHDCAGRISTSMEFRKWCGTGIRLCQQPDQFSKWLIWLSEQHVTSYLEIGVSHGGAFITTVEYLKRFNPLVKAVALDCSISQTIRDYILAEPRASFVEANSHEVSWEKLWGDSSLDLAFIDADHSEDSCRKDFQMVNDKARIVAFHDIVDTLWPGVAVVWDEAKRDSHNIQIEFTEQYDEFALAHPGHRLMGIGALMRSHD